MRVSPHARLPEGGTARLPAFLGIRFGASPRKRLFSLRLLTGVHHRPRVRGLSCNPVSRHADLPGCGQAGTRMGKSENKLLLQRPLCGNHRIKMRAAQGIGMTHV